MLEALGEMREIGMRALVIVGLSLGLAACVSMRGSQTSDVPFANPNAEATQAQSAGVSQAGTNLPAGEYRLDPRHASVQFRIRHENQLAWFTARFNSRDATLSLNPADPSQSHLTASVDPLSIDTGLPDSADAAGFTRGIAQALGVTATPHVTFTSTAIRRTGQFTADVTGDLAMNGRTHAMVLHATFDGAVVDPLRGAKEVLGFSAYGTLDRSDWGATQWSEVASDQVQIVIEAELVHT
jgi:polyisoprenoid-binding protein YceI